MKPIHQIRILKRLRGGFGTAVILGILIPQLAVANPLGPQVVSGQANFATQGKTLSVTNSDRAIINWQDFSIGNGEFTRFIQPTATSAVLNRVIGNNPSAIYGALQSNGRVYLVNQNGIFIGPAAAIDVNGLVASTLNITDGDFKAGRINFSGGPLAGRIENQGTIRTPAGGSIYLIAPDVANSGIINAPNGDILLAAGQQVSLVESTTPEIAVVVSAPGNQALNLGRIIAEAGRIGIYGGLIRHRGIVSADSAVMDKTGAIHFRATNDITFDKESSTTANGPQGGNITVQSATGTTLVSGAVEAKGSSDKGGTVQLLGRQVGVIDAAQIDASGENGGGTVLVGGDYQGKNPSVQNAAATYFGADANIKADAATNGDGGKVILWGNEATRAYGRISARGGEQSGNGGFVETSGKYLDYRGFADLRAPRGKTGTLLLDPTNIYIAVNQAAATTAGMVGTDNSADTSGAPDFDASGVVQDSLLTVGMLESSLGGASTVVTAHNAGGSGLGDIKVVSPVTWGNSNSLTLNADGNIAINAAISGSNLILYSANQPSGIAADITLSGNLAIHTMGTSQTAGRISANGLLLWGTGTYSLPSATNNVGTLASIVGGSFNLTNNGPLSIGAVTVGPYAANGITATGNVKLDVGGGIEQTQKISAAGLELHGGCTPPFCGPFRLENAGNSIGTLAGNIVTWLSLANNGPLHIGTVNTTDGLTSTGSVGLDVGGAITQSQRITAPILNTISSGGVTLNHADNLVSLFSATNSGSGNIEYNNAASLTISSPISNTGTGGGVNITSAGGIIIDGTYVAANNGNTTLIAGGGIQLQSGYDPTYIYGNPSVYITLNGDFAFDLGCYVSPQLPSSTHLTFNNSTGKVLFNGIQATTTTSGTTGFFYGGGTAYPAVLGSSLVVTGGDPYNFGGTPTPHDEPPAPTPTCPTGQQLVGGTCQPITCPTGQQLVGGICQPITCPTGQSLVGGVCQTQTITCPTGQQLVGNTCQTITCPTGQQLVGNLCQPIICPGGQVFIGAGCQCPAGTIDYAGVCKTPSIVPGTDTSTVVYFPGVQEMRLPLMVMMQSSLNAVDPSLPTTTSPVAQTLTGQGKDDDKDKGSVSGSPAGGAGDDLKPKKNYCN